MADSSANIAAHLPIMAAAQPDALAVVVQKYASKHPTYLYDEMTAARLEEESNRVAHGLRRLGISEGTRTVLMVKPSIEFFVLTFALFKVGAIPVMVDPGMGIKNLKTCLAEAEPEAFIGIPKAHVARLLFGWGRESIRINVTVGHRLFWGGETYTGIRSESSEPVMASVDADAMAAVLFTSGSTGIPKGVVYTHALFNAQVDSLRDNYGIEPGERDLATFPLFALFGPALGMASIVPDMDASKPITADPANLFAAMHDYDTTNLFASPALIEKIGRYGESCNMPIPSLRRVISAGAPADPDSLARCATLLRDGVSIIPSYGATEALPVASIAHQELIAETKIRTEEGNGLCIGRANGGLDVRIIRIDDEAIETWNDSLEVEPGVIGEICVSGPIVTGEYFERPESTKLAKIVVLDSDTFYHRMGDLGHLDDQGRIWFCGRKAHRVVCGGTTYFTIPVERVYNVHPDVRRTALVGIDSGGETIPVLCVELKENVDSQCFDEIVADLNRITEKYDHTRGITTFLRHDGFPMDVRHNAKIFREKLAIWAGKN
ncbi:MAG: fatty acid CoA ligase family protein [Candidatus Hydrogenedentota bacterium]